ncbi:MAG: 6-carboxytetrahydropterin synthase [Candidatus Latescibacterota bacterium]
MVHLTFTSAFNSFHKMRNNNIADGDNIQIFGKCANPSGHGHRYQIEITLGGYVTREHPFVAPRSLLIRLNDRILAPKFDHKDIGASFGPDFISSGENIAKAVWQLVQPELNDKVELLAVKIIETRKNSFVYLGPLHDQT